MALPANTPMQLLYIDNGNYHYSSFCCDYNNRHWGIIISSIPLQTGCYQGGGNEGMSGPVAEGDPAPTGTGIVPTESITNGVDPLIEPASVSAFTPSIYSVAAHYLDRYRRPHLGNGYEIPDGKSVPAEHQHGITSLRVVSSSVKLVHPEREVGTNYNFQGVFTLKKVLCSFIVDKVDAGGGKPDPGFQPIPVSFSWTIADMNRGSELGATVVNYSTGLQSTLASGGSGNLCVLQTATHGRILVISRPE